MALVSELLDPKAVVEIPVWVDRALHSRCALLRALRAPLVDLPADTRLLRSAAAQAIGQPFDRAAASVVTLSFVDVEWVGR